MNLADGCPRLKFRDKEWILVNSSSNENDRTEGAITTPELLNDFALNPYHLYENGDIMSFGEVIGNVSEIEWLES